MWAVKNKDKDIIEALLKAKANINAVDKKGNSILYYAFYYYNFDNNTMDIIVYLINRGADINKKIEGNAILHDLFINYYYKNWKFKEKRSIEEAQPIIELLLKKGANVNEKSDSYPNNTLLIDACKNDDLQNVKLLFKYGAGVKITNEENSNALHFVKNIEIARLLINAGINIHQVNINGWTPLFPAVGSPAFLSVLIKRKAKV